MKPTLSPLERRRAAYNRLVASLVVPQYTSIATPQAAKQKPCHGAFKTI